MKNKIILLVILITVIALNSCSTLMISEKHLDLNLNETNFAFCKDKLEFEDEEILNLTNPIFKNDKYVIVVDKTVLFKADHLYYYYLFKNDVLVYFGYPFQFHMHENEVFRVAGEEASKYAIKKDEIELKY